MKNKIKVGCGFDAHRFGSDTNDNNFVVFGGIKIPYQFSLLSHSDGDVVLHALTDALLGTIGAGDIGLHFPPNDHKWCDADSMRFVRYAHELILIKSGDIQNVDITIICESPKILPYREKMQISIASMLHLEVNDVNVKGTTTEKMGFTGRKEGVACQAVVCVMF